MSQPLHIPDANALSFSKIDKALSQSRPDIIVVSDNIDDRDALERITNAQIAVDGNLKEVVVASLHNAKFQDTGDLAFCFKDISSLAVANKDKQVLLSLSAENHAIARDSILEKGMHFNYLNMVEAPEGGWKQHLDTYGMNDTRTNLVAKDESAVTRREDWLQTSTASQHIDKLQSANATLHPNFGLDDKSNYLHSHINNLQGMDLSSDSSSIRSVLLTDSEDKANYLKRLLNNKHSDEYTAIAAFNSKSVTNRINKNAIGILIDDYNEQYPNAQIALVVSDNNVDEVDGLLRQTDFYAQEVPVINLSEEEGQSVGGLNNVDLHVSGVLKDKTQSFIESQDLAVENMNNNRVGRGLMSKPQASINRTSLKSKLARMNKRIHSHHNNKVLPHMLTNRLKLYAVGMNKEKERQRILLSGYYNFNNFMDKNKGFNLISIMSPNTNSPHTVNAINNLVVEDTFKSDKKDNMQAFKDLFTHDDKSYFNKHRVSPEAKRLIDDEMSSEARNDQQIISILNQSNGLGKQSSTLINNESITPSIENKSEIIDDNRQELTL